MTTEFPSPQPAPRAAFFSSPCRAVRARVYDASGDLVATVAYRRNEDEEAQAVRLIVAAPELLAALKAALQCFDEMKGRKPAFVEDSIAMGNEAIAKATGAAA